MNDDQLSDLKQFIANTISQTEERLQSQMSEVSGRVDGVQSQLGQLRKEMADGFEGVAEAIEQVHQQAEVQEAKVDQRLTKLQQRAA